MRTKLTPAERRDRLYSAYAHACAWADVLKADCDHLQHTPDAAAALAAWAAAEARSVRLAHALNIN